MLVYYRPKHETRAPFYNEATRLAAPPQTGRRGAARQADRRTEASGRIQHFPRRAAPVGVTRRAVTPARDWQLCCIRAQRGTTRAHLNCNRARRSMQARWVVCILFKRSRAAPVSCGQIWRKRSPSTAGSQRCGGRSGAGGFGWYIGDVAAAESGGDVLSLRGCFAALECMSAALRAVHEAVVYDVAAALATSDGCHFCVRPLVTQYGACQRASAHLSQLFCRRGNRSSTCAGNGACCQSRTVKCYLGLSLLKLERARRVHIKGPVIAAMAQRLGRYTFAQIRYPRRCQAITPHEIHGGAP